MYVYSDELAVTINVMQVSDECEVYVHIEPSDSCLWRVLTAFKSDIELATKQTIVSSTEHCTCA
jgi:hypothetical protein